MKKFTANLRRGLRGFHKSKPRDRPAKLHKLHEEITESQQSPLISPFSEATLQSPVSTGLDAEGEAALKVISSPAESLQADQEQNGRKPVTDVVAQPAELAEIVTESTDWPELAPFAIPQAPEIGTEVEGVDEQALRTKKYIEFVGEDETDYTAGPVRIVDAFDGVKESGAILLNLDFSAKIQNAVRAQRDFAKYERVATRQVEVALNYEASIWTEIANHQSRLACMEDDAEADKELQLALNEEVATLEMMLKDSENERQSVAARQQDLATMVREIQAEVNAYLEEAFVFAKLLEPESNEPDTPIEERDLQNEYQVFRRAVQEEEGVLEETVVPLDTNREHLEAPPLTEEEQTTAELRADYWEAKERLKHAEIAFERRYMDRNLEHQANNAAVVRGEEPIDATPEDFDVRWAVRIHELTHEVIEAEATLTLARTNMIAADIDFVDADQESDFVSQASDGYAMSLEKKMIESAPRPKITNWLDGMTDLPASPSFNDRGDGVEEADEWEAESVDANDSESVVAEGFERRKIDKWRQICGL